MSRSNPNDRIPNPSTLWAEWSAGGDKGGTLRYYDKDEQTEKAIPLPFVFLWLDELKTMVGYDDVNESRIYGTEVRDTSTDTMIVKSFKGGIIAEGKYRDIKLVAEKAGANFACSIYFVYKTAKTDGSDGDEYHIGNMKLKGVAAHAWIDFRRDHNADIYTKAVAITGSKEGQKGAIKFRVPTFDLTEISAEDESAAQALDAELQTYLASYLKRPTNERVEPPAPVTADDIPFVALLPLVLPLLSLLA